MPKARLTLRRLTILKLIAKGYTDKQIAKTMNLSDSNFKLQKSRLYCYLGAHKRKDVIAAAKEIGIL